MFASFFLSKLASNQSLIDIGHDICICKIKGMNIDMNEHLGSVFWKGAL